METPIKSRGQIINEIINDLIQFKKTALPEYLYAIEENVKFFQNSKSLLSFVKWLTIVAPKLDTERLLEINDLLPKWDENIHQKLIKIERKKFPGLVEPIVNAITKYILSQNHDLVLCSLGSGGMETERQVIERLIKNNWKYKLIICAIDQSETAHRIARDNLKSMAIFLNSRDINVIDFIKNKKINKKYIIIKLHYDIFKIAEIFNQQKLFDLTYNSLFLHHLVKKDQERLSKVLSVISKNIMEYDGFKSWLAMIPQTIIGWNNPAFLNAEIFSNLRFLKKDSIKEKIINNKITFYKKGYYLKEYST